MMTKKKERKMGNYYLPSSVWLDGTTYSNLEWEVSCDISGWSVLIPGAARHADVQYDIQGKPFLWPPEHVDHAHVLPNGDVVLRIDV